MPTATSRHRRVSEGSAVCLLLVGALVGLDAAAVGINLSGGELAAPHHANDVQPHRRGLQEGSGATGPFVDAHHDGRSNPCRDDRQDVCCNFECTHCGPRDYCVSYSPFMEQHGTCNPDYVGGICAHYYVDPSAPADGIPHTGSGEETACADTGFVCTAEDEQGTDYCQGWASDSVCQRGRCVQPASCASDVPSNGETTTVTIAGYEYRTIMDGVTVDAGGRSICHTSARWLPIPDGFELAPDTAAVVSNVVAAHRWATDVMVLGSLKAYGTASFLPGREFGDHQDKAVSRTEGGQAVWSCPWSCYQILVRRRAPVAAGVSAQPQTVQSCASPPNGGCDPRTTCDDSTYLFGTKLVQCSGCPSGYYGSGRSGCYDINECTVIPNGGCDQRTTCTNRDGGYDCSDCSAVVEDGARLSGDARQGARACHQPETAASVERAAAAATVCVLALIVCCMRRRIRALQEASAKPLVLASAVRRGSLEALVANPTCDQPIVLAASDATVVEVADEEKGGAAADPAVAEAV